MSDNDKQKSRRSRLTQMRGKRWKRKMHTLMKEAKRTYLYIRSSLSRDGRDKEEPEDD
jgi:hypothetical protein